jgi:putative nucleotidyltransferase with HDIG domain
MERLKEYFIRNFEQITVLVVLLSVICTTYLVDEKMMMLNFFYLPVLMAGYFIGKRASVFAAILSILVVVLFTLLNIEAYSSDRGPAYLISSLSGWGGFLLLTSYIVGALYEQKQRKINELQRAYLGVLEILVKYLESTDPYTKGHSVRVSEHAMSIAMAMDLSRKEVENIRVAALLHDIGKIEISTDLIGKAANLTKEEMDDVAMHTGKGAELLLSVGSVLKEAVPIVLEHHKYFTELSESPYDESKLSSLGTRIVAVADAFDAMTTDRPYRKGMQPWQAFDELKRCSGEQFDPDVVKAFASVLEHKLEMV